MFDRSMSEAVVRVFVYIGIGSGVFLSGIIGMFLLGETLQKIFRFKT